MVTVNEAQKECVEVHIVISYKVAICKLGYEVVDHVPRYFQQCVCCLSDAQDYVYNSYMHAPRSLQIL